MTIDTNKLRSLALDGDLAAMQAIINHLDLVEKERDELRAVVADMQVQYDSEKRDQMKSLINRLQRPGYDLQKEQAIYEAIIELRQYNPRIIPEGWKLVPTNATLEMRAAGLENWQYGDKSISSIWDDMIAAAPKLEE